MTDAIKSEPTTSMTECCFKNIVARQIKTIRTPDARTIIGCFFNSSLWQIAYVSTHGVVNVDARKNVDTWIDAPESRYQITEDVLIRIDRRTEICSVRETGCRRED